MITQKELKELLSYDPDTGVFRWLVKIPGNTVIGMIAGSVTETKYGNRYIKIKIKGISYFAHRLAFLFMNGEFSELEIDHLDGDGTNNRWKNLRSVTAKINQRNRKLPKNNSSGFCGVRWLERISKWEAYVYLDHKYVYLGTFNNREDAIAARMKANIENNFHANHGICR